MATSSLVNRLALCLPKGLHFHVHHVVAQSTTCEPIFAPPPASKPDDTTQESHTLIVSIEYEGALLHLFALEAILYDTTSLTTLFVSKADSTGYGFLQDKRHPSTTKVIVTEFLSYLVESRRRDGVKFVVSLFARAQDQYLFPGSIENSQKHVLDDRQLIKWWCKILDQVLRKGQHSAIVSKGYLKVPGCDSREIRFFFPKGTPNEDSIWTHEDPLQSLQSLSDLPERCLIPRFPDDPKARFAIDLDDELPENQLVNPDAGEKDDDELLEDGNLPIPKNPPTAEYSPSFQPDPPKPRSDGKWRSVRSLDQFWELMGFRQECAAGRLVGFIWGVIDSLPSLPSKHLSDTVVAPAGLSTQETDRALNGLASPPMSSQAQPENDSVGSRGPVAERAAIVEEAKPDLITPSSSQISPAPSHVLNPQTKTTLSRNNELVLLSSAYDALSRVLQTGDYSTLALAKANTAKWIEIFERELHTLGSENAVERSRAAVIGTKQMGADGVDRVGDAENGMNAGEAGAKRQREAEGDVKMLAGGLLRKKRKVQS